MDRVPGLGIYCAVEQVGFAQLERQSKTVCEGQASSTFLCHLTEAGSAGPELGATCCLVESCNLPTPDWEGPAICSANEMLPRVPADGMASPN